MAFRYRRESRALISEAETYEIQMEITRTVTVDNEAPNASKARQKAKNLGLKQEFVGDIIHWGVKDVIETKR